MPTSEQKTADSGLLTKAANRSLPFGQVARPTIGWLRAVREGLGLTLAELAGRMKVTPPAVRSFEQAEAEDRITLASLRRTAAAMEYELIYVLIPRAAKAGEPRKRRPVPVEAARPVPPPEIHGEAESDSIVTDLTRHTEYGES